MPDQNPESSEHYKNPNTEGNPVVAESFTQVSEHLNADNSSFFEGMSEKGRAIAGQVYEGIHKVPVLDRVVSKMEISYSQFWADRHEEKAIEHKDKVTGFDVRIGAFDRSKQEIETVIVDLKQKNIPGVESLQVKLREIENQRLNLLDEKDKAQSKLEKRTNKMKLHTNERDRVADNLISKYNETLVPMEKELENLETSKDQVDLFISVAEVRHKEQDAHLADIEKRKTEIIEALRRTGMSDKEIGKFGAVESINEILAEGREKVKKEKEDLARRKAEINTKVARVDAKANTYRDRREEFMRVKQRRPVVVEMATRQRGTDLRGGEETVGHTRNERVDATIVDEEVSADVAKEGTVEEEGEKRFEVPSYVIAWNKYLLKKYGKKVGVEKLDTKEFLKSTGLREGDKLEAKDFKNILTKYYKYRKFKVPNLDKDMSEFLLGIKVPKK